MSRLCAKFRARVAERGATAVEYGLMIALIALIILAAVALLGDSLSGLFSKTASSV